MLPAFPARSSPHSHKVIDFSQTSLVVAIAGTVMTAAIAVTFATAVTATIVVID